MLSLVGASGLLATLLWPTLADESYVERYRHFDPDASFAYTDNDFSARLKELGFESPSTDNSIADGIEVLTRLDKLELQDTQVDDGLGPALRRLPNLTYVDLSGTKVTDAIVDDLLALPNLNYVDLTDTAVTIEAARRLSDAIVERYPLNIGVSYDWPEADDSAESR